MKLVLFTSDGYLELLKDFSYLFNKHWSKEQEVNVIGFKEPSFSLPDNFKFLSAGNQDDFPPKVYCDPFLPILEELDTDVITYFFDDHFIIGDLNKDIFDKGVKLLEDNKASKLDIFWGDNIQYETSTKFDETFNEYGQDVNYRCSLSPGIIRKDYFLSFFRDGLTVHQFEINNISNSKNDGHHILVSKDKPVIPWVNVIEKGVHNHRQAREMERSALRKFGWNKFQCIDDKEDYEIFLKYKDWSPTR